MFVEKLLLRASNLKLFYDFSLRITFYIYKKSYNKRYKVIFFLRTYKVILKVITL